MKQKQTFIFCGVSTWFRVMTSAYGASRSPSPITPHSVWLHRTSDQLVAETSAWQHTTLTTDRHPCHPVGFKHGITAGERPQTHALGRSATGIAQNIILYMCEVYGSRIACFEKFQKLTIALLQRSGSQYVNGTRWTAQSSISCRGKRIVRAPTGPDLLWDPPASHSMVTGSEEAVTLRYPLNSI